jgi:uncharacterized protein
LIEQWPLLIAAAFAASTVAAIAGTGGGIILLPVLVSIFGVREAIPMYAVANLIGNLSRVGFNWPLIEFRVFAWFCVGAIPLAVLGSWLFTRIPDPGLLKLLGAFLLLSVLARRVFPVLRQRFRAFWFAPIGGVFSLISAIVGSAGPFLAPFYLSFGLVKGAFIGTEALGTAVMHITKLSGYQALGVMSQSIWLNGLVLGPVMILGSYTGMRILERIPARIFMVLVELVIAGFGLWFLTR